MIGVSCTHFSNAPVEDWIGPISKSFGHWEIFSEAEHSIPGKEHRISEMIESAGMTCSVHAPICDLNIAALSDRLREASIRETEAVIQAAVDIEAMTVTVHPGLSSMAVNGTEGKALARAQDAMKELDSFARDCGAVLAIENMPQVPFFLGRTAESLLSVIDGTDLGVCFDIGHAHTTGQIDAMMDVLGDRIVNVHIHDNHGARDEHLTIGDGSIDFRHVVSRLSRYGGNYIIESKDLDSAILSQSRLSPLLS